MRQTLARSTTRKGVALHAGKPVHLTLEPAEPNSGIVFYRTDLGGAALPALYDRVSETRLGTVIANGTATVGVVEHLMAALAGSEIDDAAVLLDGPEPPILDGSSLDFLDAIRRAGTARTRASREIIVVRRPIRLEHAGAHVALEPHDERLFEFEIEFGCKAIGRQTFSWTFSPDGFAREIAPARTFGFTHELEQLNAVGLARGASLENTLALEGDRLINVEKLRFPDEFVRHKILDAVGDLALAGAPIVGRFVGYRSGHAMTNKLLAALFADPENYTRVTSA